MSLFLLALALFPRVLGVYNETTAKYMMDFSGIAYCVGNLGKGVDDWSCDACVNHPGVHAISFHSWGTNGNGYVAYDPDENHILAVFTGTDPLSIKDWIDDIDFVYQSYPGCENCDVHVGFLNTFKSIEDKMLKAWDTLREAHPDATVGVTGHSLGAAMAVHGAISLWSKRGENVTVAYNFGQPRVGNQAFSEYYINTVLAGTDQARVTHYRDPVPHLPPKDWGFWHEPFEIFYSENNKDYKVCDSTGEDESCSNKMLDLDVNDHLNYVGFDLVKNYLGCKIQPNVD